MRGKNIKRGRYWEKNNEVSEKKILRKEGFKGEGHWEKKMLKEESIEKGKYWVKNHDTLSKLDTERGRNWEWRILRKNNWEKEMIKKLRFERANIEKKRHWEGRTFR